ncbi:MAG: trypsin-like peptidase domain-containing protein, partial [Thermodesulfobacteriota bacterium]
MEKLACFLSAIGIGFACLFPITVHAIDVKGTAAESTQEADREGKIRLKVEIVDNTASRDLPADYLWSIKNMVTGRLYSRYPRVDATIEDAAHADAVLKVSVDVFTAGSRVKRLIGLRKAHLKITAEWLEGNPPVVKDSKVFQRFGAAPFRSGRAVEQIMLLLTENYVDDFVFFHKAFLNKRQSLPPMQPGITTVSSGTCFVVSPDGLVLTAYHIVDGAETIKVIMGNGQSLKASLLHYAKSIDLAVLRVNALTPHYLSLSPSREAKVGVSVFTMGFPVKA